MIAFGPPATRLHSCDVAGGHNYVHENIKRKKGAVKEAENRHKRQPKRQGAPRASPQNAALVRQEREGTRDGRSQRSEDGTMTRPKRMAI